MNDVSELIKNGIKPNNIEGVIISEKEHKTSMEQLQNNHFLDLIKLNHITLDVHIVKDVYFKRSFIP